GMFGESKFSVLQKVPKQYVPRTVLATLPITSEDVIKLMADNGLNFPVIFKPDLGERGHLVKKILAEADIAPYLRQIKVDFLIQDLVDLPLEFGVFYERFPDSARGEVTSVVMKEMLSVTGDGVSTLKDLILNFDRAKLQWNKLREAYDSQLDEILPEGKRMELVSIGNHALGTKFLDGSRLMNERLSKTFDNISRQIEGFYFGRYDLRCSSTEDLYTGNVVVMELNGCGAEPAHIYEPGFPLTKAIGVLFRHWRNLYLISAQNRRRGVRYISLREAYRFYKKFKHATT
ncbi:MAG TPA: hypothetical protein VEB86_03635, partial [Chryseosolibacter sp.]|nr:hypothetical protein [Chryseosolibacter sp.]